MARRFKTRWAVAAFLVIGFLIAMVLLVRDLYDSSEDAPEETGTVTRLAA